MANDRFGTEYEAQRGMLQSGSLGGVVGGLLGLKKVLGSDGPDRANSDSLEQLRNVALKFKEVDKILEAAGVDPAGTTSITEDKVKKVAALKFLRHLYLVGTRGSQQVWVLSTPKSYRQFPIDELLDARANPLNLKAKLADKDEQFDSGVRSKLGEATQLALVWAESAKRVLAAAGTDVAAMKKVKKWFAASATPQADIDKIISKVLAGFKLISGSLSRNNITITDMPQQRNDPTHEYTEAFMLSIGAVSETPRTIYIEQALFHNFDISVLHDMKKNWTRVILHEVTHIDGRTKDVAYAWQGIGVGTKITSAEAAVNADTWAFFAADCAGALTDGDVLRAMNGTGGSLTRLSANWT